MLISSSLLSILFILPLISCDTPANKRNASTTWTDTLKRDLLVNYDKFVRPSEHDETTNITIGLTVKHIDIDELKSIMNVFGWIKMEWKDNKLVWNPSEYGNLQHLYLADHEIWQPDITLYNSALGTTVDHYANTMSVVNNSGNVIWVPPFQFQVFCEFDMRLWPFDTQTCDLYLGSWVYSAVQIDLQVDHETEIALTIPNHEWKIINVKTAVNTTYYECCTEPYISNTFTITVERFSGLYKTVVVAPATCVILMTLAAFWLPPQSGEKIILNGINIIIIVILMLYFGQKLPVMAIHTPLVVLFYSSSLHLVSIAMIVAVLVNYCANSKHTIKVPWFIKSILDGWLGNILGLCHINYNNKPSGQQRDAELRDQPFDDNNTADDRQMISNLGKVNIQHDWLMLATALDRIFFLTYCLVFVILAIMYSV